MQSWDVAIVGGGPGGSTVGALLRRYRPDLSVLILEKEMFPRDHIGESQLPSVSHVLHEMGCWEKVEAANFPIKIGASFTWGKTQEAWDFDFMPPEDFVDEPRPAKFEGQRRLTAFQVDRAVYDEILLRHAQEMGAAVRESAKVERVEYEGDRIDALVLESGEKITAKYYIDASGAAGFVRRAIGIGSVAPMELRNIAIWDYWQNADWAFRIGVGGTRIVVRSLSYGWLWFIPLGPTRTSVGLVCPSRYYKEMGKSPADLYHEALRSQKDISALLTNATARGEVQTTKDWSHVSDRLVGENWFLTGEAAGFADPILSAGMALTHSLSREVAYTILELEQGELDPQWLRERFERHGRLSISQHIRFAQFWYSANGAFTDLKDHCQRIAQEAGLRLNPQQAWRWLASGGFVNDSVVMPQFGSFDIFSAQRVIERLSGRRHEAAIEKYNVLKLNLHGAEKSKIGDLRAGRIVQIDCYIKGERRLPMSAAFDNLVRLLQKTDDAREVIDILQANMRMQVAAPKREQYFQTHLQALETMIHDGWIIASFDKKRKKLSLNREAEKMIRDEAESNRAIAAAKARRTGGESAPPPAGNA